MKEWKKPSGIWVNHHHAVVIFRGFEWEKKREKKKLVSNDDVWFNSEKMKEKL